MTPRGSAIWVALAVLLAAGFFGSILARCRLSRSTAAVGSLAVGIGSFAGLGMVNLGGGLAAALWGTLLLCRSARAEVGRALTAAAVGATVLYALVPGPWLVPFTLTTPLVAGFAAGLAIHLLGGRGRAALAAALLAGPAAGLGGWVTLHAVGMPGAVVIGGGIGYGAQTVALVVAAGLGEASVRWRRRAALGSAEGAAPAGGPAETGDEPS